MNVTINEVNIKNIANFKYTWFIIIKSLRSSFFHTDFWFLNFDFFNNLFIFYFILITSIINFILYSHRCYLQNKPPFLYVLLTKQMQRKTCKTCFFSYTKFGNKTSTTQNVTRSKCKYIHKFFFICKS